MQQDRMTAFAVRNVFRTLQSRYRRSGRTASDLRSPYRVLIATILSARTRDEVTDETAGKLFLRYPSVRSLAGANVSSVRRIIRRVGFPGAKSQHVVAAARMILRQHRGRVPDHLDGLLQLPGVGRKTANVVLNYAFGQPAIAVDTHVHRVANRLGWVSTRTSRESETKLEFVVPKKMWRSMNDLFVKFGKNVCKPRVPQCWTCPILRWCAYPAKILTPRKTSA